MHCDGGGGGEVFILVSGAMRLGNGGRECGLMALKEALEGR